MAVASRDEAEIRSAGYKALREGGAAAFYIHHFAETVLRARPELQRPEISSVDDIRPWLEQRCFDLRTEKPSRDVSLLRDIADSLKHPVLTRKNVEVSSNDAVLILSRGYGQLKYGEGNYGGAEQVLVLARSGTRALSSILQNVIDAGGG